MYVYTIYRYTQLRMDFNNDEVLSNYLESILMQPIVRARPYYAAQLVYTAEFALMPLLFILFYTCSTRLRVVRSSRSSHRMKPGGNSKSVEHVVDSRRRVGLLSSLFYDSDLLFDASPSKRQSSATIIKKSAASVEAGGGKGLLFTGGVDDTNHYPLLANHKQYSTAAPGEPKLIYSKKLKPTPFELAANSAHPYPQPNYYQVRTHIQTLVEQ